MNKLLFVLLLGIATEAQAQVFRPGRLVLVSGDTLRGEIEDNAWDESPTELRLRATDGRVTTYPAARIQRFQLADGQSYQRETVPLDRTARTRTSELTEARPSQQVPESLLLNVLVDGTGQLLYTAVADVPHYFVRRPGWPFVELVARRFLRHTANGTVRVEDGNNYQVQLQQVFADSPAALQALAHATFTAHDLVAVVQAYNQQVSPARSPGVSPNSASPTPGHRIALHLNVVAGGRYASARLSTSQAAGVEAPVLQGANLDGVLHPLGGLTLEAVLPGRRNSFLLNALLTTFGRDGSVPNAAPGYAGALHGRQTMLEGRVGIRHYWPLGTADTHLLVGTGLTLPFYLSGSRVLQYGNTGTYRQATPKAYAATSNDLPATYPQGRFIGNLGLPYAEVGVRQGRFTLLLDGRLGLANDYYTEVTLRTEDYSSLGYTYSYTPWYVGLLLSYGLLQQH